MIDERPAAPSADRPSISVLIPALNAERWLPETIASLQAQSREDWEAVVVADGSIDGTADVVREVARADPRFRIFDEGPPGGVAAARTRALEHSRGKYIAFLDADDLVTPDAYRILGQLLDEDPGWGVVRGRWRRIGGASADAPLSDDPRGHDLFEQLASECVFAIHAAMTRRSVIDAAGGMTAGLRTCEDWDLWQRIARLGTRFGFVPDEVAHYRFVPSSLSSNAAQMMRDGLIVIDRGHAADPRVAEPSPLWKDGARPAGHAEARLGAIFGAAAWALGRGEDPPAEILDAIERDPSADATHLADCLLGGLPISTGRDARHWEEVWSISEEAVLRFLTAAEDRLAAPNLAGRMLRTLETGACTLAGTHARRAQIGRASAIALEVTEPIPDLPVAPSCDRLAVTVTNGGTHLGRIVLPASDGMVPASVLADCIGARFFWELLGGWQSRSVYPALEVSEAGAVSRDGVVFGQTGAGGSIHDDVGWAVFLQQLWGCQGATEAELYLPEPDLAAPAAPGRAVELEVCEPQSRWPRRRHGRPVIPVVGGRSLALLPMGGATDEALRSLITTACGMELARTACALAVVGFSADDPRSLRERLAAVARERRRPARTVLGRHADGTIGGSASRVAQLPGGASASLLEAAQAAGEPIKRGRRRHSGIAYDPGVVWEGARGRRPPRPGRQFSATRRLAFETLFASNPDPWSYDNGYEREKYERTLELVTGRPARALELACAEGHLTTRLAERCEHLMAMDISSVALGRAARRCRGLANVEFAQLDLASDPLPVGQYDLIICSEVLYYLGDLATLREAVARLASALAPGGRLVAAHGYVVADDPTAPGFDWGAPFGAVTIGRELEAIEGLNKAHEIRTELYEVTAYERTSVPRAPVIERRPHIALTGTGAEFVEMHGVRSAQTSDWLSDKPEGVADLPVLMYHQVCDTPGPWTITPAALDEQLEYLAGVGYGSITLDEWSWAVETRTPLPDRRVLLTFDDGFENFAEEAWPLLERHGFTATVFLVTDRVGATNAWDAGLLPPAALMDWDRVAELAEAGVEFGSHTATHADLLLATPEEVANEMARARAELTRRLGAPPRVIAYPYGSADEATGRLAGACGHEFGLSVGGGAADFASDFMLMPRIEVSPADDLASFTAKVAGHAVPA